MKPTQEAKEPDIAYLDLQAYIGTTKHMGGLASTTDLIRACHIDHTMTVLDVGCGVGATPSYLAKHQGCHVVGVDLRESMIARAKQRVQREGVQDRVEFRVADARSLPFEDDSFDALLCESVATFIEGKQCAVNEFVRVVRPGGYVGLNEEIWLKPAPANVLEFAELTWDIPHQVIEANEWQEIMERAGLQDIVTRTYALDPRREATQVKRYRAGDMWRMFSRTISLYVKNPEFRKYMKARRHLPRDTFEYLGYGLFAGSKGTGLSGGRQT